ncbi:membrane fusion protein, cobalt-zinc-cadmium efflux system [Desulfuromusa kysingii]|uniref:Membrane fusion protein, cobalt-zinc-cadmium efflux system n=1 Tax=Desulfuromusa kysingii TaxID=37625 RepID=A0A1H3WRL9_9BACT|nr:efflux RND transporter periplasmic adaptor subunit [Desulfuromusa kysingii]SDZ89783.1 membrane fusion protein, cobalt-zinc-cadmium efflux system [Desulfuromusa kysingii]
MRKLLLPLLTLPLAFTMIAGLCWLVVSLSEYHLRHFDFTRSSFAAEKKIKYWAAPMDPTYIRNKPGKSPMGMDLIPVYEDDVQNGSTIRIDSVTTQNMGVRTTPVIRGDIAQRVRTVGLIDYEESKQYSVNAKISGWVEKLYINETGQQVKKGDPLLAIYSPDLVAAQQELILAKENADALSNSNLPDISSGAQRLLEASRQRLKLWDISDTQIAKIEQSGQTQKRMTLYSSYSGIISLKKVNEGMYIKSGMALFEISDISRIWIYADIYESDLPFVKIGQKASVLLPYAGEKLRPAMVSYLYPYVEAKTRTVKARLEFANPDMSLRPEMYVNVEIQTQPQRDVLLIPAEAVLNSGDKQRVFIALGEGKFSPRDVETGIQGDNDMIEIKSGVDLGDQVVVSAQFMFDSESRLREAINKMLEPKNEKPVESDKIEDLFAEPMTQQTINDLF